MKAIIAITMLLLAAGMATAITTPDKALMDQVKLQCSGCFEPCKDCSGPCGEVKGPAGRVWMDRECPEMTEDGQYYCYCDTSDPWEWTIGTGRLARTITADGTCKKDGQVPEFTAIAAGIAVAGAGAGYFLLRRK